MVREETGGGPGSSNMIPRFASLASRAAFDGGAN